MQKFGWMIKLITYQSNYHIDFSSNLLIIMIYSVSKFWQKINTTRTLQQETFHTC